jgi:peptidyl-prolyl cis-trans isomerase C
MPSKLTLTAVTAATLLILGCEQAASQSPVTAKAADPAVQAVNQQDLRHQPLVTINGQPITGEMFSIYMAGRLQKMPGVKPTPQLQNQILNELINIQLLAQVARSQHLESRPEVTMVLDMQRDELLSRLALQEQASKSPPSEEDLKKLYDEKYATPRQEYKAAHILVKSEEEAKKVIAELNQGADFATLAKEHSIDSNAKKGGDLGWFEASQMVKPFSDAAATMEIGTISKEPVKTQFGWHVIKLEDKRAAAQPPFAAIRKSLHLEAQRKALSEYVNEVRSQAKIEANQTIAKKVEPAPTK